MRKVQVHDNDITRRGRRCAQGVVFFCFLGRRASSSLSLPTTKKEVASRQSFQLSLTRREKGWERT